MSLLHNSILCRKIKRKFVNNVNNENGTTYHDDTSPFQLRAIMTPDIALTFLHPKVIQPYIHTPSLNQMALISSFTWLTESSMKFAYLSRSFSSAAITIGEKGCSNVFCIPFISHLATGFVSLLTAEKNRMDDTPI